VQTWPQFAKIYVIVHSQVYVVSNCMKIHTIRITGINYPTHGRCQEFCKLKIRFSFFSIGYNGVNFRPEFAAEFCLLLCRLCILKSIVTMPGKMIEACIGRLLEIQRMSAKWIWCFEIKFCSTKMSIYCGIWIESKANSWVGGFLFYSQWAWKTNKIRGFKLQKLIIFWLLLLHSNLVFQ
jgi:hypothetical protein